MKIRTENSTLIIALALSAGAALIYEVVATNVLFFYFARSSYSVATVLGTFLLGLGVGSYIAYQFQNKFEGRRYIFGIFQIGIALYSYMVLANLLNIVPRISEWGVILAGAIVLLPPTILIGAVFPLAAAVYKKHEKDVTGLIYSSDLAGAIIGTLLAGFLFIPLWGNKAAVLWAVGFNLLAALLVFKGRIKFVPVILALLLAILYVPISGISSIPEEAGEEEPIIVYSGEEIPQENYPEGYQYYKNSPYGLISVRDGFLYIDERGQCSFLNSEGSTERNMADQALIPLDIEEMHVLNIGLGCGGTVMQVLNHGNVQVDVVEINPIVEEVNRKFVNVLDDARVNLILNDGLSHLRNAENIYDSILIDIDHPFIAHSSAMYTVDAFRLVKQNLSPTGTVALWNFEGSASNESLYLDILYYSMKEVFDYVYQYDTVFVATDTPFFGQYEYLPTNPYEINTIDKNTLTNAFLGHFE